MIETGIGKSRRIVAIFAAVARLRVTCRLSNGFLAIVAGYAGLGNAAMVETADRPFIGCMAGITRALGCNMIGILARSSDIIMAACTSRWRSFKNAALVAGFAGNLRMAAGQRKTCREMVELVVLRGLCRRRDGQGKTQRQQKSPKCKTQLARQILPTRLCPSGATDYILDKLQNYRESTKI